MTEASVKVVVFHLGIGLIEVPVIVVEAVGRAHHTGAMTTAGAVDKELARRRVIH